MMQKYRVILCQLDVALFFICKVEDQMITILMC